MINNRSRGRPTIGVNRRDKYLKIRMMESTYDIFKEACNELDSDMSKVLSAYILSINKSYKRKDGRFKNSDNYINNNESILSPNNIIKGLINEYRKNNINN